MTEKELRFFINDVLKDRPNVYFWFHKNDPYDGWSYGVQEKQMAFCSFTFEYNRSMLEVKCSEEDSEEFQRLCSTVQRDIVSRRKSSVYLSANRIQSEDLRPIIEFAHAAMMKKRGEGEQR
jgi:hypothetical protein